MKKAIAPSSEEPDGYDDLEYPPPSKNKDFRKIWAQGIKNITERENFDVSHLSLFEIYCGLIISLRGLDEDILKKGRNYTISLERSRTISQISTYVRLLDLIPSKDRSRTIKKKDETNWE